ncbi:YjbF family lipoprotein [uncultured Limnohabitans sp.]|uniref:YjbF family lipoprotein n=1 Tax=uncultured Limnohabitans sp. TaxID=768543 RepID=UPI00261984ED|nr:YjbF family lipoprotein [uncultured Limnohabitans sp.]
MLKPFVRLATQGWLSVVVTTQLLGCASGTTPLADVLSALATNRWDSGEASILAAQTNPLYRHLRIEVQGRAPALLVLGYVDPHPQGDIEVWYSAKREVIKTQNGRIVGTSGLEVDWRAVRFPEAPPLWTALQAEGRLYQRLRDEMPGHRYAIADHIELKPWLGSPPITLPASLASAQARNDYHWFSETTLDSSAQPLPPSWFAWGLHRGQPTVVYSEQCLSATFCLKLQRWPVQESTS